MKIDKVKYTFYDERDCSASTKRPEFNQLRVKSVSNGMANYIVIETARWALDEEGIEQLYYKLHQILKEANEQT